MARKPRITVLQPDPLAPLERFDGWLREGVRITTIELWSKDVPNLETIGDGLIVLGATTGVDHEARWVTQVKDLMADAQAIGLPVLGICLGHQLLAEALGGSVSLEDEDGPQDGPVELEWLPGATEDPVLGQLAASGSPVAMSHGDVVVELPEGATELARSVPHPNQAFRLGSAVGVQFHPEASPELVQLWWQREHGKKSTAIQDRLREVDHLVEPASRTLAEGFIREVVENA